MLSCKMLPIGGDQHIGTRGVPREVELEQSMMPQPDPALYRVQVQSVVLKFLVVDIDSLMDSGNDFIRMNILK